MYKKVGDEIVLKPGSAFVSGASITWKHGPDIAMEWDGDTVEAYRQFEGSMSHSSLCRIKYSKFFNRLMLVILCKTLSIHVIVSLKYVAA